MKNLNFIGKIFGILSIITLLICPIFAFGGDYPEKTIYLLIPYGPGGVTDLTGRCLADIAREILGQPVIAINKAGGGGVIAQSLTAKEKPDGYTLAITSDTAFTQIPQMREVSYDPLNDFEFIIGHMQNPGGIVCRADKPWKSMKDLIAHSKQNPEVSYGCAGAGGAAHIATEFIMAKEAVKWRMVPFDGSAKLTTGLLGGHVDIGCSDFPNWKSFIEAKELRPLAVEGILKESYPGVPTFEELGYELPMGASFGIIAPKGTPRPIIKKLQDAYKKAMDDPRYISVCEKLGASKVYSSGEEYFKRIKEQYEVRGKILERLGMKKSK